MRLACVCAVLLLVCASAHADPIFTVTPSNTGPAPGDTVTFTVGYDGDGLGLILARFDADLGGTGTWDTPTSPTILVAGLSGHGTADAGTPVAGGVDNVVLAINYQSFPWSPADIGASTAADIWSVDVKVDGNVGDTISLSLSSELHSDAGAHVFYSDGGSITVATQLATGEVTLIPEPSSLIMLGMGGVALLLRRRRRA